MGDIVLSNLIEVKGFEGQGYRPLVSFGNWRVAALRYLDDIAPDRINSMERHTATDEVFILVNGKGMLIIGGNDQEVKDPQSIVMKTGDFYNVKKDAWHTIVLSEDAKVILVENDDTGEQNTDYYPLPSNIREKLQQTAREFLYART